MVFVLKHKLTAEIATDTLINTYNLPYYGTMYWDDKSEAEASYVSFLENRGDADPSQWELIEIDAMQMKIYNVKLKNDASLRLFLDEQGKPHASRIEL